MNEPDFEVDVALLMAQATNSDQPFFFPSPLACRIPTFLEPLARLNSHIGDVDELIPDVMNRRPSLRDTFGGLVDNFCSDYPDLPVEQAWKVIVVGHAIMMSNFAPKNLPSIEDIRIESLANEDDTKLISISYSQTYGPLLDGPEMGRNFYYSFLMFVPDEIASLNMFFDLWSRLSAVPRSGTSQGRSALLLLAAFFEEYLMETMEVALANGTALAAGLNQNDFKNWKRFGFQDYVKQFHALVATDILEPMVEPMARRNAFIHRGGLADAQYVERFPHLEIEVNQPIRLEPEYLRQLTSIARSTATDLTGALINLSGR